MLEQFAQRKTGLFPHMVSCVETAPWKILLLEKSCLVKQTISRTPQTRQTIPLYTEYGFKTFKSIPAYSCFQDYSTMLHTKVLMAKILIYFQLHEMPQAEL
jgi:hypothetical protein